MLVDEALLGSYSVTGNNSLAIRLAMKEVNIHFNTDFDYMSCWMRLRKLKHRFGVFRWLVSLSGVSHNEITNQGQCSPKIWEFICQKKRMAAAYMEQGEKKYDEMKYLFQEVCNSVNEAPTKVIEILSDHEDGGNIVLAQRRLFDEPAENEFWEDILGDDNESLGSDGEVNSPSTYSTTETKKNKKKLTLKTNHVPTKGEGSSVASFSPFKKV